VSTKAYHYRMPNELNLRFAILSILYSHFSIIIPIYAQVFQVDYFLEFSRRGAHAFLLHACYTTTEHITAISCEKKFPEVHLRRTAII